jgi:hypothetical protein
MRARTREMVLAALFAVGLSACDNETLHTSLPAIPAELGAPVKIRIGQTATYNGGTLKVSFDNLLEDSRCPVEYVCVEAGEVRVRLGADQADVPPVRFDLSSSSVPLAVYDYAGFRIAYINLEPQPSVTHPPQRSDYLLSIVVTAL